MSVLLKHNRWLKNKLRNTDDQICNENKKTESIIETEQTIVK